jgi:hypothetical protein
MGMLKLKGKLQVEMGEHVLAEEEMTTINTHTTSTGSTNKTQQKSIKQT